MKKLLILSIYPAPYRAELFEYFFEKFNTTVFFEHSGGDARAAEWFVKGEYYLLDTKEGREKYKFSMKHINQYNLVAVYDYSTKEGINLILKCRQKGVPFVVNSDGAMLTAHGNVVKDFLKRFLLSKASACLASGEMAKKYFLQLGVAEGKIYIHTFSTLHSEDILPSLISQHEKRVIRNKLGLPTDKKIAIAVGRFIPLKRYQELIEAWKGMPQDYLLLLIGGGEEESNYRKCIADKDINNVILEGFHPKKELFEFYKASDVFVHPTCYDVWGLVVNEAMACGLPVVVSDHCVAGLELIKNGENGYLVALGNDKEIGEKVMQVCEQSNIYESMAQAALETIRPYTIENMADTHKNVFKEILKVV